jgi:hypothetical protein
MDSNYTKRDIQFMFGDYEGLPMPSSGAEPEFYTLIRSTPPEQLYELFVSTYNETGRLPVSTDPGVLQASIDVLTKVVVNRSTVDRARVRAGDMDAAMKAEVAAHNKKAEFDGWVWGHIAMHSQIPPTHPQLLFRPVEARRAARADGRRGCSRLGPDPSRRTSLKVTAGSCMEN